MQVDCADQGTGREGPVTKLVPDLTDFAPTDGCVAPLQMPFLHDESISRRVGMLGGDVVTLAGLGIDDQFVGEHVYLHIPCRPFVTHRLTIVGPWETPWVANAQRDSEVIGRPEKGLSAREEVLPLLLVFGADSSALQHRSQISHR